jgi:phosphoglycolate phosphatase-like HAD superfamily hydrolase
MLMGQAAGVATCAVTYGMHSVANLRATRPDVLIDRFLELLSWAVPLVNVR